MQYWIDRGRESGVEDELLKKFEGELNRQYQGKGRHIRIHVHFIPTARDELMRALRDGGRASRSCVRQRRSGGSTQTYG
jgi:membrane-bound lytic murein transglycosylase MltF